MERTLARFDEIRNEMSGPSERLVTAEDLQEADQVFQDRVGNGIPDDLREFWTLVPSLGYNGANIWPPVPLDGPDSLSGITVLDPEFGHDGFVLFGDSDDTHHFAYNGTADLWQKADFFDFYYANEDDVVVDLEFSTFTDFLEHWIDASVRDFHTPWAALLKTD